MVKITTHNIVYELIASGFPKWKSLQSITFNEGGKMVTHFSATNHTRTVVAHLPKPTK